MLPVIISLVYMVILLVSRANTIVPSLGSSRGDPTGIRRDPCGRTKEKSKRPKQKDSLEPLAVALILDPIGVPNRSRESLLDNGVHSKLRELLVDLP